MIYLDHHATPPFKPAVQAAVGEMMGLTGHPASAHRYGRAARRSIEEAKARLAALVGTRIDQVHLTNSSILSCVRQCAGGRPLLIPAIEEASLLAMTSPVFHLPVRRAGVLDLAASVPFLTKAPPSLIVLSLSNAQTGVIQPVAELAALARRSGHKIFLIAGPALGRLPIDFQALGVDYLALDARAIGGGAGLRALLSKTSLTVFPSTGSLVEASDDVPGLVGFGVAAQLAADDLRDVPRLRRLRDELQGHLLRLSLGRASVVGVRAPRLANVLCLALQGANGARLASQLEQRGVIVAPCASCSGLEAKNSHVLRAMGYDEAEAASSIRISLGWTTQMEDLARCLVVWGESLANAGDEQQRVSHICAA